MPRAILAPLLAPAAFALALPVAALLGSGPAPALAQETAALTELHRQDLRLAGLADRLLAANRALCRRAMPVTGMVIHSRDQYAGDAAAAFAGEAVGIAAVVPGSPAEAGGLEPGDALVTIAGRELAEVAPPAEGPLRDAVFEHLAALPPDAPIALRTRRAGELREVTLAPRPGCRALVEVLADNGRTARSDGRVVQLSLGLVSAMSDDGLAAILAHELAHLVLEHRRRLEEAGVSKGLFSEFGENRRRNRAAEEEADRLSVHLLANAGLDPRIAPAFWHSREGRSVDAGIFRSAIYPPPSRRAELMEREIDEHLPPGRASSWPGHLLALRETAF